jgi:hypothetical protein
VAGRKELRFVQADILGQTFSTLKITEAHKKSKSARHYVDKMKYLGCLQCGVPKTASFRTFATDKKTRRSHSGNRSVNQGQSTWKCLQLRYSTTNGLRLHILRPLLRLPVAISLPVTPTFQFSSIPNLYSIELQRQRFDNLTADEIFEISFLLLQQCQ